jgi:predicted phosphodiesterase
MGKVKIIIAGFLAFSLMAFQDAGKDDIFKHDLTPPPSPWLEKKFDNGADKFTFAIFSDLNGGEREGIFNVGAAQLRLLRPELIVSIGDLIDGGTEDEAQLTKEWDSFDKRAEAAGAPIFRVGGNHDLTNVKMREVWAKRYGPRYYHFIYKDVLFLIMDSEDFSEKRMRQVYIARDKYIKMADGPTPEKARGMEYMGMIERSRGEISPDQSAYFERVLADNPNVKWTFLFMHKPTWLREGGKGMSRIEAALQGQNYTVFNGHEHTFRYRERLGMDYIMLGTTGGAQNPNSDKAFDHLTLINMDNNGPTISHIRMDGLLDKTGNIPANGNGLCYQASKCRK